MQLNLIEAIYATAVIQWNIVIISYVALDQSSFDLWSLKDQTSYLLHSKRPNTHIFKKWRYYGFLKDCLRVKIWLEDLG